MRTKWLGFWAVLALAAVAPCRAGEGPEAEVARLRARVQEVLAGWKLTNR